jgi:hypothetical protein
MGPFFLAEDARGRFSTSSHAALSAAGIRFIEAALPVVVGSPEFRFLSR